jgi:REP element-mobilizing transposase RayT
MKDYNSKLETNRIYHIYNRSIGKEKIFLTPDNYHFFLMKYKLYISPIAKTYCYCLMPNHFHFLVKIKNETELKRVFNLSEVNDQISDKISKCFSNLFSSYTQSFNSQRNRQGSLFKKVFKRIMLTDEDIFTKLVHYIHFNPVKANLCRKPENWRYSSYNAIISTKNTMIDKKTVIDMFDGIENFMYCHRYSPEVTGINLNN